jgi:hypothetical protein
VVSPHRRFTPEVDITTAETANAPTSTSEDLYGAPGGAKARATTDRNSQARLVAASKTPDLST